MVAGLADLGDRFRLVANEIEIVAARPAPAAAPGGPRGLAARPGPGTSAEAWLTAGGPHHTVLSQAVGIEELYDLADMTGVELAVIDADTTPRRFADELRWNQAYYRLARGL